LLGVNQNFDEIHVYESVAERTGNTAERTSIRGRRGICRSLTELGAKCRSFGDGYYYLPASAWPPEVTTLDLRKAWHPLP
jgi:hypothetical protein